ncbi:MAG: ornithine cyclodeaminase family protein [Proteobacteria bacterium]|nr:ornithine cyclodeaminase family protein [Pseudomonadota bacterium]
MIDGPQSMREIIYLNQSHLDSLDLNLSCIVDVLEDVFRHKAAGDTVMPPKIFFHLQEDRFYSAMASCCPPLGYAGSKWQSGDPANPSRGLPYIQGLFILNENETGQMVAIIDARWITGKRTAAASALVARYQAKKGSEVLALLGCGVQGRTHLEALAAEVPSLKLCQVFDIVPERQAAYIEEMDGRFHGVQVIGANGAKSTVKGADIVISGGPIQTERNATIVSEWIKPGALIITIDYDSYVTDECIAAMDIVLTDDYEQIQDAREREGKFLGVTQIDADNAEMIAHGKGRRRNNQQRILAFNLGIALEDVATAAEILRRASEKGIGIRLAP